MYSCVYPYMYIYNIFCSLIYIYISNPTKFYIASLVYSYSLNNSQFFFLFSFFFFFFFSKLFIFDGRHANLRVSYNNFIINSLFFSNIFALFCFIIIISWCIYNTYIYIPLSVWLAVIYNRDSQPNDFALTLCVAFVIIVADSAITNHSDDYKDPSSFSRTISHSHSLSISIFQFHEFWIVSLEGTCIQNYKYRQRDTRSRRFTPFLSYHYRRRCRRSLFLCIFWPKFEQS